MMSYKTARESKGSVLSDQITHTHKKKKKSIYIHICIYIERERDIKKNTLCHLAKTKYRDCS